MRGDATRLDVRFALSLDALSLDALSLDALSLDALSLDALSLAALGLDVRAARGLDVRAARGLDGSRISDVGVSQGDGPKLSCYAAVPR